MDLQLEISQRIGNVSAFLLRPPEAWMLYVLAHGAGGGMRHRFLESISAALAARGIATFRFQFPYMQGGRRRPDAPAVLEATVRVAVSRAGDLAPDLPLFAGGKSFGGRMTSNAAAVGPLPRVKGLVFLGFPLHPPGRPGVERAEHLDRVSIPMLFLQGSRDAFARADLIEQVCRRLERRARLHTIEGADHSFTMPGRSERTSSQILEELANTVSAWARPLVPGPVGA